MPGKYNQIKFKHVFLVPNLLSAARVFLTFPAIYYLACDDPNAQYISLGFLTLAGFTDFFDGLAARKLNQQSRLGLVLDPLADKLMTISVIIGLLIYRDFPLWLALTLMTRDLAILTAAALMTDTSTTEIPPSDLYGKYYFSSIPFLLIASLLRFEFGYRLFEIVTLSLLILSITSYGFRIFAVRKGRGLNDHRMNNRFLHQTVRIVWYPLLGWYVYRFITDIPEIRQLFL